MLRYLLLAAAIFLLAGSREALAQRSEFLFEKTHMSGIYGGPLFNFTYYDGEPVRTFGGYFSIGFDQTINLGWQWMSMKDRLELEDQLDDLFLKYNGFMLEFTPWGSKVLHPKVSYVVGPGRYFVGDFRKRVLVMQPSAGLELNVWRVFKLGVEGGHRFILRNSNGLVPSESLNAWFLQVDLRFGFTWD